MSPHGTRGQLFCETVNCFSQVWIVSKDFFQGIGLGIRFSKDRIGFFGFQRIGLDLVFKGTFGLGFSKDQFGLGFLTDLNLGRFYTRVRSGFSDLDTWTFVGFLLNLDFVFGFSDLGSWIWFFHRILDFAVCL